MREIKFSCMWSDGKSWMDLRYTLEQMEKGEHFKDVTSHRAFDDFTLKVVRQYTGVNDCYSAEIYEGDIVQDCDTCDIFTVKYGGSECPAFDLDPVIDVECNGLSFYVCSPNANIKVIGNIYQSPELLEKKT